MEVHTASELLEMGLLEKKTSINTEVVFLRDITRRSTLFTSFGDHNPDDETIAGVEWGKENVVTQNGIRCNANTSLKKYMIKQPLFQ